MKNENWTIKNSSEPKTKIDEFQAEYDLALELLKEAKLDDFAQHGFNSQDVARDRLALRSSESKFENPSEKRLAVILEAIVYDLSRRCDWLGEEGLTVKATRFDDVQNGIDQIFILQKNRKDKKEFLGIAIDATLGSDTAEHTQKKLMDKLSRIRKEIQSGHLATAKYVYAQGDYFTFDNIPRIVVGRDVEKLIPMIKAWGGLHKFENLREKNLDADRNRTDALIKKIMEEFQNHSFQFEILAEIKLQLEYFMAYAQEVRQPQVAQAMKPTLEKIEFLLSQERLSSEGKKMPSESMMMNNKVYSNLGTALMKSFPEVEVTPKLEQLKLVEYKLYICKYFRNI